MGTVSFKASRATVREGNQKSRPKKMDPLPSPPLLTEVQSRQAHRNGGSPGMTPPFREGPASWRRDTRAIHAGNDTAPAISQMSLLLKEETGGGGH
jgi:hypothetical protein